jgi:hypothetical protein
VAPNDAIFVGDGGSDELDGAAGVGMAAYQATWFLDRWPAWRRAGPIYERASGYPRLRTLADLRALVAAQRRSNGRGIALRSADFVVDEAGAHRLAELLLDFSTSEYPGKG